MHPDDIYNVNVASQQLNTHSDIFATSAMVLFANAYFSDEIGISSAFCNNDVETEILYREPGYHEARWTPNNQVKLYQTVAALDQQSTLFGSMSTARLEIITAVAWYVASSQAYHDMEKELTIVLSSRGSLEASTTLTAYLGMAFKLFDVDASSLTYIV